MVYQLKFLTYFQYLNITTKIYESLISSPLGTQLLDKEKFQTFYNGNYTNPTPVHQKDISLAAIAPHEDSAADVRCIN